MACKPNHWSILSGVGALLIILGLICLFTVPGFPEFPLNFILGAIFGFGGIITSFIGCTCRYRALNREFARSNSSTVFPAAVQIPQQPPQPTVAPQQYPSGYWQGQAQTVPAVSYYGYASPSPNQVATPPVASTGPVVFVGGAPVTKSDESSTTTDDSSEIKPKKKRSPKEKSKRKKTKRTQDSDEDEETTPSPSTSSEEQIEESSSESSSSSSSSSSVEQSPPRKKRKKSTKKSPKVISSQEPQSQPKSAVGKCVICSEAESEMAMVPCGHKAVCESCARGHATKLASCPICRRGVVSIVKIYNA